MADLTVQNTDSPPPRRRASTRDREAGAAILSAAMAEGMLSPVEFDDRSARVYAATYRDELATLTADVDHANSRVHAGRHPAVDTGGVIGSALTSILMSSLAVVMHHRRAAVTISLLLLLLVALGSIAVTVGGFAENGVEGITFDHERFPE